VNALWCIPIVDVTIVGLAGLKEWIMQDWYGRCRRKAARRTIRLAKASLADKNGMFSIRSWFGVSIEEFCALLDDYIYWYHEKRIKLSLGGKSPLMYRRSLGLAS